MRASRRAISVFPTPVEPIMMMFLGMTSAARSGAGEGELAADFVDYVDLADIPARCQALQRDLQLHGDGVGACGRKLGGFHASDLESFRAFLIEQAHADGDLARLAVGRIGRN